MLGEIASEKGLGKSEMLNLRMCEGSITKHALGHGDAVATKESLVTGATGGLGTGVERTGYGFASGCIERIKADGTGHVCNRIRMWEALMRENAEKKWNQFFGIYTEKHLTSDETWWLLI